MRLFAGSLIALAAAAAIASSALAAPKLSRTERKAINRTVNAFVLHAVRHKDAAKAYGLVSPTIRAGMSPKQFARQNPIYPYPARGHRFPWSLDYVEPDEVGGSLLLQPSKGAKTGPILFDLRLTKHGGRWLVESLIPKVIFGIPEKPKVRSVLDYSPQAAGDGPTHDQSRISGSYIVIPFAVFGALLAGLAAWGVFRWNRDRKIALDSLRARDARARATH
jgi:hypothetical protein